MHEHTILSQSVSQSLWDKDWVECLRCSSTPKYLKHSFLICKQYGMFNFFFIYKGICIHTYRGS